MADKSIALALSGGGVRAMVFHMGVLKALAERNLLEKVSRISTVSGGSLLLGLILQDNQLRWPTSTEYLDVVYPSLREKLCTRSIMCGALKQLLYPWNWKYLLSRANAVAKTLEKDWGVTARLSDLPSEPEISINGTPAETELGFDLKKEVLAITQSAMQRQETISLQMQWQCRLGSLVVLDHLCWIPLGMSGKLGHPTALEK